MELLKLSKFKLNLRALITEVRQLRVSCLQNDNALLENKQKELKETVNSLLQSREKFVKVYKDSTCEMKRSIESRDRKIAVLSEKINAHLSLIDSIEKEAFSVKQVVDNAQHVLSEKDEVVAGLKIKVDKVSTFEKLFLEKVNNLENRLKSNEDELRKKDQTISGLEAQLEAERNRDKCQRLIEEQQETLSAKEGIIQNLISEKKALHFELGSLNFFVRKIQDTVMHMNEENRRAFSSALISQEECRAVSEGENRIEAAVYNSAENSPRGATGTVGTENTDSPLCREKFVSNPLRENNFESCASEPTFLEPESATNVQSISDVEAKATRE